jgi:hypothetical protein
MPQLIYKKVFFMDGEEGEEPDLTLGKSYDIVCSTRNEDGGIDLLIITNKNEHHTFELESNQSKLITLDHFTLVGDYTDVWEDA